MSFILFFFLWFFKPVLVYLTKKCYLNIEVSGWFQLRFKEGLDKLQRVISRVSDTGAFSFFLLTLLNKHDKERDEKESEWPLPSVL